MNDYFDTSLLHTTALGMVRIRRNLGLSEDTDPVGFCKDFIARGCNIRRAGKNYYCEHDGITITVNARSLTIITAHSD